MKRRRATASQLTVLLFTLCLPPGSSAAEEQSAPPSSPRVLLAFESTAFKKVLIAEMETLLRKDSIAVTVVEHSGKSPIKENPVDYGAVFITNSGVNSMVRPWISAWIAQYPEQVAKMLLHTTQIRNWKVVSPVDAVTSASKKGDAKKLAASYTAMLKERIDAVKKSEGK